MAATGGQQDTDVAGAALTRFEEMRRHLAREPFRFNFFQAVWLLERMNASGARVGLFSNPRSEAVRFTAHPSLAFPASDIQALELRSPQARMLVNFMGLIGPSGVLPQVYTELVAERARLQDYSLSDFLDILNHRLISLFYLAWARYRFPVENSRFRRKLLSLAGLATRGLESRQEVEDDSFLFYTGLLALQPRSATALKRILEDYFQVPVEVEQFIGAWYRLSPDSTCRFEGQEGPSERLGVGVVVGDEVWDPQSRVRIRLGPLTMVQYTMFLPGRQGFLRLRDMTRFFSRGEFDFEVQLVLRRAEVPGCRLDEEQRVQLGWTSWVKTRPVFPRDAGDAVLPLE